MVIIILVFILSFITWFDVLHLLPLFVKSPSKIAGQSEIDHPKSHSANLAKTTQIHLKSRLTKSAIPAQISFDDFAWGSAVYAGGR